MPPADDLRAAYEARVREWLASIVEPKPYVRGTIAGARRRIARWICRDGTFDYYCARCFACGEVGCCSPRRCDGGHFCEGYYGDAAQRERLAKEWEDPDG